MKNIWLLLIIIALASCAHESTISPSPGHIDDQQAHKPSPTSAAEIPKPVKSNAFVPPPKPKAKEQTYSVVVNEVPVKEILFALARESKLNIDIHPAIQGRVTLNAVDQTLPAILERLARQVDLTYKIEGNVLNIRPDQPVLRTYKVDYVNMSRDTAASVGAAAEIATTGGGSSAGGQSAGSSAGGSANSSRTQVSSISKNHFWETLTQNIKDILAETDKEVLITRQGNPEQAISRINAEPITGQTAVAQPAASSTQDSQQSLTEYKTLFAATVIVNPETGVLNVRATNKQHEKVQEFLDKVMTSAKRQVLIEATIVEVELKDGFQAGIDWSRLGSGGKESGLFFNQSLRPTVIDPSAPVTTSSFRAGYVYTGSGILADLTSAITLLQQFGDTKVLSSPKLMVLNNQTAVLKVVDNLVYFTIEAQTSQTQTNLNTVFTTTPHTVPVGVVMSVTPQINDNNLVMLNVRPTVSRFIGNVQDPNPSLGTGSSRISSTIPIIQVREMESLLRIESGNTAVLGGLMQDDIKRNSDNVPGIYKVPVIGKLFSGKADLTKKSELVIFLRPVVIQNASLESDELQSYKQFMPTPQLQQTADESAN